MVDTACSILLICIRNTNGQVAKHCRTPPQILEMLEHYMLLKLHLIRLVTYIYHEAFSERYGLNHKRIYSQKPIASIFWKNFVYIYLSIFFWRPNQILSEFYCLSKINKNSLTDFSRLILIQIVMFLRKVVGWL